MNTAMCKKSQKNLNSSTNELPCDLGQDTRGFIFLSFFLGERGPSCLLCKATEGIKVDRGKTSLQIMKQKPTMAVMPIIPTLWRQRQEDQPGLHNETPSQKDKTKPINQTNKQTHHLFLPVGTAALLGHAFMKGSPL